MIEIRQDADGTLDEVVSMYGCASVHLESLGENGWYLWIEANGDQRCNVQINFGECKAFIYESEGCKVVCSDPPPQSKPEGK
jgi:hypothetical protein